MGCDIHCFIEYKTKHADLESRWEGLGGRIGPDRNYLMFALMAGVRSDGEIKPVAEQRGFPTDAAWRCKDENLLRVVADGAKVCEGEVTLANAQRYVATCGSTIQKDEDGNPAYVTHPDWHSHSWLTAAELKECLKRWVEIAEEHRIKEMAKFEARLLTDRRPSETDDWIKMFRDKSSTPYTVNTLREYLAVQRALEAFEETGCDSRVVFWFDN